MKERLLIVGLGFLLFTLSGQAEARELKEGQTFPEITLPSLSSGEPLSISDFRGHKVLLHVWASW